MSDLQHTRCDIETLDSQVRDFAEGDLNLIGCQIKSRWPRENQMIRRQGDSPFGKESHVDAYPENKHSNRRKQRQRSFNRPALCVRFSVAYPGYSFQCCVIVLIRRRSGYTTVELINLVRRHDLCAVTLEQGNRFVFQLLWAVSDFDYRVCWGRSIGT